MAESRAQYWKRLYTAQSSEVSNANARERKAFMAGCQYACTTAPDDWDQEQGWQQYRCQDDSDWKATVSEEPAPLVLHPECKKAWDRGLTDYPHEEHIRDCAECRQWNRQLNRHSVSEGLDPNA